jgi:hypothetical protein
MEKRCTGPCGELKPVEAFSKRSKAKDGRQSWCKACMKARKKVKPTDPKKQRAWTLKHRYGVTVELWDQMLINQSGLCALCNEPMKNPHVDHSHTTLVVRGLLCLRCNTMLGDVERLGLLRIEQYLLAERSFLTQTMEGNSMVHFSIGGFSLPSYN